MPRKLKEKKMCRKILFTVPGVFLTLAVLVFSAHSAGSEEIPLTPIEQLGKILFFDTNLSSPPGQACATCHASTVGFTGPDPEINVPGAIYPGALNTRFGNRKPPTAAYGGDSPVLYYDKAEGIFVGGLFWDGRATGKNVIGDPLAEQAQGPFLNPLEHNLANAMEVCDKVRGSGYVKLFEEVWGPGSLDCEKDVEKTYELIARSISAYERSREVSPFTSKYDHYIRGKAKLTEIEKKGLELFEGKGKCANCHPSQRGPGGEPPLFTDFTYDNIGVPVNPHNPFYSMDFKWNPDGREWRDPGLGGFLKAAGYSRDMYEPELGKMKVPTLRNVDKRPYSNFAKSYGHNGYFKSLKEITHFYNTRDVLPGCESRPDLIPGLDCWPEPEVSINVNKEELGNLGLTDAEEDSIVAFMKTLSDGVAP